jgi:hypothetical protein
MSMPPAEKQPQVITSDDKELQILHHTAGLDNFGGYAIKGALKNLSAESNIEAEIRADYYDLQGQLIDSEIEVLSIPRPGGSRGFLIVYPGLRYDDIHAYTLSVRKKSR